MPPSQQPGAAAPAAFRGRVSLRRAIESVPAGRWGVAVSGGADSVALLRLLRRRAKSAGDLELVVIHLDHEMRGEASQADAAFVEGMAHGMGFETHIRTRTELAGGSKPQDEGVSAWLRGLRLAVYREAVERHGLAGVLLAHHADDVAETMLLRLLRGSPRSGTLGMAPLRADQLVAEVRLLRPLLGVRRRRLRRLLERSHRRWREDASNAEPISQRNRVRRLLAGRETVANALLELAASARRAEQLLEAVTPRWLETLRLVDVSGLPPPLQRRAARRWMVERGVPEHAAGPKAVAALLSLVDAAGPQGVDLPGGVHIRRRRGCLEAAVPGRRQEPGPGRAGE